MAIILHINANNTTFAYPMICNESSCVKTTLTEPQKNVFGESFLKCLVLVCYS